MLFQVTWKYWACNVHCLLLLAEKTLASPKGLYPIGLLSNYLCRNIWCMVCIYIYTHIYIYIHIYIYMLFQNCILLKDSRNSPLICRKKDVVSKTICAGVCLQGAPSKRDRMWQSPVFTCIRANRIPVKRIKRTFFRIF